MTYSSFLEGRWGKASHKHLYRSVCIDGVNGFMTKRTQDFKMICARFTLFVDWNKPLNLYTNYKKIKIHLGYSLGLVIT